MPTDGTAVSAEGRVSQEPNRSGDRRGADDADCHASELVSTCHGADSINLVCRGFHILHMSSEDEGFQDT